MYTTVSTNAVSIELDYTPFDMVSSWNKANLSSNFCSSFFDTPNEKHSLSELINECIELSIKFGTKRKESCKLQVSKQEECTLILLDMYIFKYPFRMLKGLVQKIKRLKNNHERYTLLYTSEFSEVNFALYNLIVNFKGNLSMRHKKICNDTQTYKLHIAITIPNKELNCGQ